MVLAVSKNIVSSDGSEFSSATVTTTNSSAGRSQISETTTTSENSFAGGILETSTNIKVYTFSDLKTATKNFRPDTVLGQGGFGKVYKGWVNGTSIVPSKAGSAMIVAVKRLHSQSLQGFAEWRSEVHFLGKLSHPNLVKLLGYCWEDTELLLVYEFMSKGSLENHLFRRSTSVEPLSWDLRLNIAIGAARGLAFLHSSNIEVIFRDFKTSNILVDSDYTAKLSDFGLAKLGPKNDKSHVTTRIMGTHGYAAPEYMATGHLYVKSDVYAFGVVLLEIMTGLRAHDSTRPKGQKSLVEWLKPKLQTRRKLKTIMDTRITGQYSSKAMSEMARIALSCLEPDPKIRPHMSQVLDVLEHVRLLNVSKRTTTDSPNSTQSHRYRYQAGEDRRRSPIRYRASPGRMDLSFPVS